VIEYNAMESTARTEEQQGPSTVLGRPQHMKTCSKTTAIGIKTKEDSRHEYRSEEKEIHTLERPQIHKDPQKGALTSTTSP